MPVGACRQLVGSSSECPSESVGSLSAACRQPVGSLSGGPVGPCRVVAGACQSLSEHVGAVGACQSLSGPVEERVVGRGRAHVVPTGEVGTDGVDDEADARQPVPACEYGVARSAPRTRFITRGKRAALAQQPGQGRGEGQCLSAIVSVVLARLTSWLFWSFKLLSVV